MALALCAAPLLLRADETVELLPERVDLMAAVWYPDGRCDEIGLTRRKRGEGVRLSVPDGGAWGGFPLVRLTGDVVAELAARGATGLGLHDPRPQQLALLAGLPGLQVLDLRNPRRLALSDLRALQGLSQLRQLQLDGAEGLQGSGLACLRGLERLELLRITGAPHLRGEDLQELAGSGLRQLDLSNCWGLGDDSLALVPRLKQLRRLELAGCLLISDAGLAPLADSALEGLRLDQTAVGDAGMASLPASLRRLSLAGTPLTRAGLQTLVTGCPRLEALGLAGCAGVGPRDLRLLARLKGLRRLDLRACDWVGGAACAALSSVSLASLDLGGTPVRGADLRPLPLESLRALRLEGCSRLGAEAGAQLARCVGLRELSLGGSGVGDAVVAALAPLTALERLDLQQLPGLTDAGLKALAGMHALRELDLNRSGVTDAGLLQLRELKSLRLVDLYGCQVSSEAAEALRQALPGCRVRSVN